MREEKFHIYLNDDEYSRVIQSLIRLKNSLIAQGRYTDGVDDVLCKVLSAKKGAFCQEKKTQSQIILPRCSLQGNVSQEKKAQNQIYLNTKRDRLHDVSGLCLYRT